MTLDADAVVVGAGLAGLVATAELAATRAEAYVRFAADTLGTLEHIMTTGYDYTWFLLTPLIIERELALSGSEQNPTSPGRALSDCSTG